MSYEQHILWNGRIDQKGKTVLKFQKLTTKQNSPPPQTFSLRYYENKMF